MPRRTSVNFEKESTEAGITGSPFGTGITAKSPLHVDHDSAGGDPCDGYSRA